MSKIKYSLYSLCIAFAVMATTNCVGEKATAPTSNADPLAMASLSASPLNIVMAVGGAAQIDINGYSTTGELVTDFDSVTYSFANAADSMLVHITQPNVHTLQATGVAASSQTIQLDVLAYRKGARLADEVLLNVTPSAIAGATLVLDTGTTTIVKKGAYVYITPMFGNGVTQIPGFSVRHVLGTTDAAKVNVYRPGISDPVTREVISPPTAALNYVQPNVGEGAAYVYAEVNAYGTLVRDSVLFKFVYPSAATIYAPGVAQGFTIAPFAANQVLTFAPGATITFANFLDASGVIMDYTFSDSTAALPGTGSGNIRGLGSFASERRKFVTPGRYTWTLTISGSISLYNAQSYSGIIEIK